MLPRQASQCLAEMQLVDVRQPHEFASGHIEGSVLIPLKELPERHGELDSAAPTLVICQIGQRSDFGARYLRSVGFDAHNLDGGIAHWMANGLPLTGPLIDGYGEVLED